MARHVTQRAAIALGACVASLAAQNTSADLEAAYRKLPQFKDVAFDRVDKPPFVFFLERDGEQSRHYLADLRMPDQRALLDVFTKRIAGPGGLSLRPGPLPLWIFKHAKSFKAARGKDERYGVAYFDPVREHVLILYSGASPRHGQGSLELREVLRLIVARHGEPGAAAKHPMSAWLIEGLLELLLPNRSEKHTGKTRDFYRNQPFRLRFLRRLLKQPVDWSPKARIAKDHHPLQILTFRSFWDYIKATGIDLKKPQGLREQADRFYDCAYGVASFFDRGSGGRYRSRWLRALELELAGKSATDLLAIVAPPNERQALVEAFGTFLGAKKKARPEVAEASSAKKRAPAKPELYSEPGAKPIEKAAAPPPAGVRPARASGALAIDAMARFDAQRAAALLEGATDAAGNRIRTPAKALADLLDAWRERAKTKGVPLFLPVTESGKRVIRKHTVKQMEATNLVVARGRETQRLALAEVPAHLFAEASLKLGQADANRRSALKLLIALQCDGLDQKAAARIAKRAARHGVAPTGEELAGHRPLLATLRLMRDAERDLSRRDPEAVLDDLARHIAGAAQGPELDWIVRTFVERIIHAAFPLSKARLPDLHGAVALLPGGRVRVVYDWSDAKQIDDWLRMRADLAGLFTFEGSFDSSKAKLEITEGHLCIHGKVVLRHKIQFVGDLSVKSVIPVRSIETDDGPERRVLGPPWWFLHGRPNGSSLFGQYTGIQLRSHLLGFVRKGASEEDLDALFPDTAPQALTFARKGDKGLMMHKGEVLVELDVAKLPAEGALVMAQPQEQDEHGPRGVVGETIIEGTPHEQTVAPKRAAFVAKWRARFRALR